MQIPMQNTNVIQKTENAALQLQFCKILSILNPINVNCKKTIIFMNSSS